MKAGIVINAGDPRTLVDLAALAEAAGWDGVFTYDAIEIGSAEMYDPWTLLAAMAMRTSRVTLGAIVFAPTRRRPWKLAREALTVDHLSGGRLVIPVGLGALDDRGFANVGEVTDTRARATILDETLTILDGLWSGEPFEHQGDHYRFGPMTFRPRPIQRPRIPIWVVGAWPVELSIARALRWDGIVLQTSDLRDVEAVVEHVRSSRPAAGRFEPFEIVVQGSTPPDPIAAAATAQPYADAGATWWIDADWKHPTPASLAARVAAGPPRSS
ncbi:MAG TPA: LLM class flavin-dependent oxidoreductase [Candidatus Eisenbacteria bacterium]|nr:LLM class flavin-dependent oxidoreductase [Candidatus Eisenbacteria bacterium]